MITLIVMAILLAAPFLIPFEELQSEPVIVIEKACEEPVPIDDAFGLDERLFDLDGWFTENRGQLSDPDILYFAHGRSLSVGLTSDGAVLIKRFSGGTSTIRMRYVGCAQAVPIGIDVKDHPTNFLLGNDESKWVRGARSYSEVVYEDLYDGVDLRYYFSDGTLKYDLEVDGGADPNVIMIRYEGADGIDIDPSSGDLILRTRFGNIRDSRPVLFQGRGQDQKVVDGVFVPKGCDTIGFSIPSIIDTLVPYTIDPGLLFSSFWGGTNQEDGRRVRVSGDHVYIVGETQSPNFTSTPGAFDTYFNGSSDGYVLKISKDGTQVAFCTFIGGPGEDNTMDLVVLRNGTLLLGSIVYTETDFPVTQGAYDVDPNGGADVVLSMLSSDGARLLYSTRFGGSGDEYCKNVAVDDEENVYICGAVWSTDLPVTGGAFCNTHNGGNNDAWFAKFDSTLTSLEFCSYLGGSRSESHVNVYATGGGEFYVSGNTASTNFPTTSGAYCETIDGTSWNMFISRFNGTGGLVSSTLLGTPSYEFLGDLILLDDGRVAVTGTTDDPSFPLTDDAYDDYMSASDNEEGTLTILDSNLTSLGYSTFMGGNDTIYDNLRSIRRMPGGESYVLLIESDATDIPTTIGAYDRTHNGGKDIYVMVFNLTTNAVEYSSVIGGLRNDDLGWSPIDVDDEGKIYVAGNTTSPDWPITEGVIQEEFGGQTDILLFRLDPRACTVQGAPSNFGGEALNGSVALSWDEPVFNGCVVEAIRLYYGLDGEDKDHIDLPPEQTSFVLKNLTNGETYSYSIAVVNSAGLGPVSDPLLEMPLDLPGPIDDLELEIIMTNGSVNVSWSPPAYDGGMIDGYKIFRKISSGTYVLLLTLGDVTSTIDDDPKLVLGENYTYHVKAFNREGDGPVGKEVTVQAVRNPDPPKNLKVLEGNGKVTLDWKAPDVTGGLSLEGYRVLRGTGPLSLISIAPLNPDELAYEDISVTNGEGYWYAVEAYHSAGTSVPTLHPNVVIPYMEPGVCRDLDTKEGAGYIRVTWSEPLDDGGRPIMGYRLYYGLSDTAIDFTIDVGNVTSYTFDTVKENTEYWFKVAAINAKEGAPTEAKSQWYKKEMGGEGLDILWIVLVIVIVIVGAVAFVVNSSRSRRSREAEGRIAAGPVADGTGIVMADLPMAEDGIPYYIVEEVFLVYKDGRLITDCARPECETADADLMSGMLIAVQGLIQDGLERGGALESIKFGSNRVLLASGEHVHVAVVLYGRPTRELMDDITDLVPRIEGSYAGRIENWVGDPDQLEGITDLLVPLLAATDHLTRDEVMPEETEKGVKLLSAVDFHQGYVRLKMAAVNGTDEVIADAAMEFTYNHDMLRLERVEPESLTVRGDRIHLGAIKPKEKLTVAFMFDPQICQETYIDGMLIFYDPKGELKTVQMKRRHADVVCPIFFTKEHANTAMLKRLIKEKLSMEDLRVFRYPKTQPPDAVLKLAQGVLSADEMQMVRQFEVQGPPYKAEVWYYAETKVKGYQMVIRLGVLEDMGTLEVFAASTSMEPITGLLADFRRELDRAMEKHFPEGVRMEEVRDDVLRMELMQRPLMLDQATDEE